MYAAARPGASPSYATTTVAACRARRSACAGVSAVPIEATAFSHARALAARSGRSSPRRGGRRPPCGSPPSRGRGRRGASLSRSGRLGRVEVLRLVVAEGARAEAQDLAAPVADLDRQAVAEPVVDAARLGVLLEEARLEERLLRRRARRAPSSARPTRRGPRRCRTRAASSSERPRFVEERPRGRVPRRASRGRTRPRPRAPRRRRVSFARSTRVPLRRTGSVMPASRARYATASGNSSRSVSRTNVIASPFAPQPKQ